MSDRSNSQGGFTLIETMVSLIVISLMAVAGGNMLITTLQGSRQVSVASQHITDLQVAHAMLRDDFAQAVERLTAVPEGLDPPTMFEGRDGAGREFLVRLTRSGWVNPAGWEDRGDLQRIEYILDEGQLIRKAWARPDAVRATPVFETVLLEGVEELSVRYRKGASWNEEWYAAEGSAAGLPDLLEMNFRMSDGGTLGVRFRVGGGA